MNEEQKFKKEYVVLIIFIFIYIQGMPSYGCSAFMLKDIHGKGQWLGKSYDWELGHGSIFVNQRNRFKKNAYSQSPKEFSWISKYGSLTFSQFGKEFPVSGVNEKSLVVETLRLSSSQYPDLNPDGPARLNELQWVQYILDTSASVKEAIYQSSKIDILPLYTKVHYFVCDQAECATFEYLNKNIVINRTDNDKRLSVLTNNEYIDGINSLKKYSEFGGSEIIPQGYDSKVRFARLSAQIKLAPQAFDSTNIFQRLQSVQSLNRTQWTLVYNFQEKSVEFFTKETLWHKLIRYNELVFDCSDETLVFDMNSKIQGEITSYLEKMKPEFNKNLIRKNVFLSSKLQYHLMEYPDKYTSCNK